MNPICQECIFIDNLGHAYEYPEKGMALIIFRICEEDCIMENEKIFGMYFAKVYPMLLAKAERKGRTKDEVDEIACWLTGYSSDSIHGFLNSDLTYGDFFRQAPAPNPDRKLIRGTICGVRVESIQDPLMQEIRYLDKLVDELAKGKKMEQILRK